MSNPTYTRWWLVGWSRLAVSGHHSLTTRGYLYAKSDKARERHAVACENHDNRPPDAFIVEVRPDTTSHIKTPMWLYEKMTDEGWFKSKQSIVKRLRESKLLRLVRITETDTTAGVRGKQASMMIIDDPDGEAARPRRHFANEPTTPGVYAVEPDYKDNP